MPRQSKKFKEVSEAYEVLKDEQNRAAYDQFGHAALKMAVPGPVALAGKAGGFSGFGDIGDIFEEFFGGGGRQGRRGGAVKRGAVMICAPRLRYHWKKLLTVPNGN